MATTRRQRKEANDNDVEEQDATTRRTRSRSSKAPNPNPQERAMPKKRTRKAGKKTSATTEITATSTEEHISSQQPVSAAPQKRGKKPKTVAAPHDNGHAQCGSPTSQLPAGKRARGKMGKTSAPGDVAEVNVTHADGEASAKGVAESEAAVRSPPVSPPRERSSVSPDEVRPAPDSRSSTPVEPARDLRPSSPIEGESDGDTGRVGRELGDIPEEFGEDDSGDEGSNYHGSDASSDEEQDEERSSPPPQTAVQKKASRQTVTQKRASKQPSRGNVQRPPVVDNPSCQPPVHEPSTDNAAVLVQRHNEQARRNGNKPGPLPNAVKEKIAESIQQLKQTIVTTAEETDCGYEKLLSYTVSLLNDHGIGVKEGRSRNSFNVFESWCPHHYVELFKGLNKMEIAKFIKEEYRKMLETLPADKRDDPTARRLLFAEQYEWAEDTNRRVLEQSTNIHRDCQPVINKFQNLLQHAHSEYGIAAVVLMFSSVNSDQGAAVRNVLGEAPEVKRMLTEQAAMFKDIMNQVQAFVAYHRQKSQEGRREEMQPFLISRQLVNDDRDWGRRACKTYLSHSIVYQLRRRGQAKDYASFKIPWSNLPSFLYDNKLRISDLPQNTKFDNKGDFFKSLSKPIVMELANQIHKEMVERMGYDESKMGNDDFKKDFFADSGLKEYEAKPVLFKVDDISRLLKGTPIDMKGQIPLILSEYSADPTTNNYDFRTYALVKDAKSYQREVKEYAQNAGTIDDEIDDETVDDMSEEHHSSLDRDVDHRSSTEHHGRAHSVAIPDYPNVTQASSRSLDSSNVAPPVRLNHPTQSKNNGYSRHMGSRPESSSRPPQSSQGQPVSRDQQIRHSSQVAFQSRDYHGSYRNHSNKSQRDHLPGPSTQRLQSRPPQNFVNPRTQAKPIASFRVPQAGSQMSAGRVPPLIPRKRTADDSVMSNDPRSHHQHLARQNAPFQHPPPKRPKVANVAGPSRPPSPHMYDRMAEAFYPGNSRPAALSHEPLPQGSSSRIATNASSRSTSEGQARLGHGVAHFRSRQASPILNARVASTQISVEVDDDEVPEDSQNQHVGESYNGPRSPMNDRYNHQRSDYRQYRDQQHIDRQHDIHQYGDLQQGDHQHGGQDFGLQYSDDDEDYDVNHLSNERGSSPPYYNNQDDVFTD